MKTNPTFINTGDHSERPKFGNYKVEWEIGSETYRQVVLQHERRLGVDALVERIFREADKSELKILDITKGINVLVEKWGLKNDDDK